MAFIYLLLLCGDSQAVAPYQKRVQFKVIVITETNSELSQTSEKRFEKVVNGFKLEAPTRDVL